MLDALMTRRFENQLPSNHHLANLAEIAKYFAPSFDRLSRSSYAARSRGRGEREKECPGEWSGERGEEEEEEGSVDSGGYSSRVRLHGCGSGGVQS